MRKSTSEKIQEGLEKKEQIQNEIKRLMQRQKDEERKARNHRICKRGGYVESLIENASELTDEQFYNIISEALTLFKKQFPARVKLRTPVDKTEVSGKA